MYPATDEIKAVTTFFKRKDLPETLQVNNYLRVLDMEKFRKSHLLCLEKFYKNGNERIFYSYWDTLIEIKKLLENGKEM